MKAVILAAGEGVRLQPITATRPKHLIRVGGKAILEHCLDALKACGVTEALVVTHYMGEAIRGYFGDGSKLGIKIEYVEQKAVLGTGDAAGIAEPYVEGDFRAYRHKGELQRRRLWRLHSSRGRKGHPFLHDAYGRV